MAPTLTLILPTSLVFFLALLLLRFRASLKRIRSQYKNAPGLKHDPTWGHLIAMGDYVKGDAHVDYAMQKIWEDLDRPPFFYIDTWPLTTDNVVVIADAELAERISKPSPSWPYCYPKSPSYRDLRALTGDSSILVTTGERWKTLRKTYNPGFNTKHLQSLLPEIVGEVQILASKLQASIGKVITLGEMTTPLTIDVISNVVFGHSIDAQRRPGLLTTGFQGCLDWQYKSEDRSLFHQFSLIRPLALWYYERRLNAAIDAEIHHAFINRDILNWRSVLALTLAEEKGTTLRPEFLNTSRDQIKTFLLAGFDTTSSSIQWLLYELSMNPAVLARLRAEHTSIFGPVDPEYDSRVVSKFINEPEAVLQKMTYTTATIKENLRVHTVASGSRGPPRGTNLTATHNGDTFTFDDHIVFSPSHLYHSDPKYWGPDVAKFKPERFLEDADWKVPAFAFRPFDRGPRACIGLELVYLEIKVVLTLLIQRFDFEKVFDTQYKTLYNIRKITAKPNDGMRMRVHAAAVAG